MKGAAGELEETDLPADGRAGTQPHQANTRIFSVEIGRGLAALAVVIFHANVTSRATGGPYMPWMSVLEHGVDFFFVLSGFIIYTAHAGDIGKAGEVVPYIKKRCIRLFPLLWAVVLGYAALRLLGGEATDGMTLLRSLIPYPSLEDAQPLVIWTLRHELLFYLMFAFVIWRPRFGWPMIALWAGASVVQILFILSGGQGVRGTASLLFSSFTLDFMMGIALAAAYRKRRFAASWLPLIVALVLLAVVLWLTYAFHLKRESFADYVSVIALLWMPVLGAAFAAVVYGLLCVETFVSPHNWLIKLGSASYAVYLAHTPVGGAVLRAVPLLPDRLVGWGAVPAILTVTGVTAGFMLHYYFERPLARWLRKHFVPAKKNHGNQGEGGVVPVANAKGMADTMR